MYTVKKNRNLLPLHVTCTFKIFNVVDENEVISNLNLTFIYINFMQIYIKFNEKCTKLGKIL